MLIEVRGLKIAYEGTEMVHGVDFTLKDGEVLTIVGESGSGKTSVIRAMLGCLPHVARVTAGEILYDGKDMTKCSAEDWRHVSGKTAAMIFQDSGSMMDPSRTIGEQFVELGFNLMLIAQADFQNGADVLFYRHFAEDGCFLRQIADACLGALVDGAVAQLFAVERDAACIGGNQSHNHIKAGGFARAVGPE